MKLKWILIIGLFILSACDDLTYRYYTRINADGTVFKRITAQGDSSSVYNKPFSFNTNEGWNLKYDKEIDAESGDTIFCAVAEKTFVSIEDINQTLHLKQDSAFMDNIKVELTSRFAWFFTFYEYSEVFLQRFPFKHASIDDYLNNEEYAYFFLDDTTCVASMTKEEENAFDSRGEKKFWKYLSVSMGIEFSQLLNNYAAENGVEKLSDSDSLFVIQLFDSSMENGPDIDEICNLVDEHLNASWVFQAYCDEYFSNFERQLDDEVIFISESDYFATLEVPGLPYETNASSIEKDIAYWQFKRGRFYYKDHTLYLKYRTINYWAFIIVGMILIALASSLILKRKQ
ncbi:hypothetical protein [Carboxylicivirga marina]|uniref:Transmembrane protein n=1 Tax=Carboxylicivirga marina TaxID=2800988 RepID=A0ABS1HLR0_9BACT|nr:hypothetical protein [Carboxylicivirga marina]MBK3518612.1 hypothetical protein [Carboxylicivirga marina]